jgi:hypothetical protein
MQILTCVLFHATNIFRVLLLAKTLKETFMEISMFLKLCFKKHFHDKKSFSLSFFSYDNIHEHNFKIWVTYQI